MGKSFFSLRHSRVSVTLHWTHSARAHADEHLFKLTSRHVEERDACQQSKLSYSKHRTVKQATENDFVAMAAALIVACSTGICLGTSFAGHSFRQQGLA